MMMKRTFLAIAATLLLSCAADAQSLVTTTLSGPVVTTPLTDGANIAVNGATGGVFTVTLGANGHSIANPTNVILGQQLGFEITQPASNGPYTVSWGSSYNWLMSPGIAPAHNQNPSATTPIDCVVTSTTGPVLWCKGPQNSAFNDIHPANPAGPTGFTTLANVQAGTLTNATMAGIGLSITPVTTGNVEFVFNATVETTDGTIAHGIGYECSYGTGTAPTANAALTGTQTGGAQIHTNPVAVTAADVNVPVSCMGAVYGATLGTTLWFDVAQVGIGATGGKFINAHIIAWEIR